MGEKITTQEFIKKAQKVHGDKYDYSKVDYINSQTKIIIVCPEHGEFEQVPNNHLNGRGCLQCKRDNQKISLEEFIKRSNIKHNNKYDYSLVDLSNNKIKIICPEHGEFEQRKDMHLFGSGCLKCKVDNSKLSLDEFIERSNIKHNGKYDYSLVNFTSSRNKVIIICPEHGEFKQQVSKHLFGSGCPHCKIDKHKLTLEEFIERSNIKHNNKYDYSLVNFNSARDKVKIICPIHGEFEQFVCNHLHENKGCLKCFQEQKYSKAEEEIYNYLKQLIPDLNILKNNRNILDNGKELDLYIPELSLAIEYNGLYWHSEKYRENNYHQEKYKECLSKGIRLIQIFEDEWLNHEDIVKDRLKHILNLTENKIYARKCKIMKLENKDVRDFLDDNHIQGYCNAQVIYGLFYDTGLCEELVSLMSFDKQVKDGVYEFLRFVSLKDYSVIGGASKLFNHFIKEHKPEEIYSYCDLRWSQGNLYKALGFEEISIRKPNYFYISGLERLDKSNFNKDILIKDYDCPQEMKKNL